ncbi:MAG: helix-turn-helix domain-containing protein [Chloroflexi bacterium]|nr:helix-turn-helix domain-containing protein [Chloroflexota bacterium]MBI2864687.1 helix-turn-helix domain-containing protein [Chloroflexota bacterium]
MRLEDDRFYTVAEVEELLRLSKRIVLGLLAKGDIPGVRYGKKWRVLGSDLRRWHQANTGETEAAR